MYRGLSVFALEAVIGSPLVFTEVSAQLVFLLFGQVGLDDLELLSLDRLSHPVRHRPTRLQVQSSSVSGFTHFATLAVPRTRPQEAGTPSHTAY